jgi:proteasome lid subunit RPN8/RPN11
MIGGKNGSPRSYYPIKNISSLPERRFDLDPAEQIETMRSMRACGEELFAIFHSHPTAPAEPSEYDIEQAAYPEAIYLIVSLNTKGVLELRGFRIDSEGAMSEVCILL